MKALIIAAQGIQDIECAYPYYRLQEAGFDTHIASVNGENFTGINGMKFEANLAIANKTLPAYVQHADFDDCDLLVLPGGVKAMEKLRLEMNVLSAIVRHHERGRVIASICSGAQLLISAGIVKGKRISGYYAMQIDIENAGAEFVDMPAVVDSRICTSPHYKYLGAWMKATLNEYLDWQTCEMVRLAHA